MENGVEKLFRKLIMRKYPMYLDVYVRPYFEGSLRYDNPFNRKRYEVFLVLNVEDFKEGRYIDIKDYVRDIGSYMNVEVMGVYYDVINE